MKDLEPRFFLPNEATNWTSIPTSDPDNRHALRSDRAMFARLPIRRLHFDPRRTVGTIQQL